VRVGLQTWGTEGDIRPFFALAHALKERGHDVHLVYSNVEGRDMASLGRAAGIEAQDVGGDVFRRNRGRIAARARENFRIGNPVKQLNRIFEDTLDPIADEMYEAGRQLAARSQLVVAHFLAHPVISAAEVAARPYVCLAFAPVFPTRHHPPMGAPRLGPLLNPFLWWVAGRAMDSILAPRVNPLRERVGLPTARDVSAQLLRRARLSLLAMSPQLLPRPADWDERIQLCGFLSLDEDGRDGALEPQLLRFLDSGPPPAFFSLGSMANLDEERAAAAVHAMVEATSRLGTRAVVQLPEAALAKARHAANIHYLSRAPHALLFPRCSVLLHHGGAGTTHAALRAGRPSIVIPHIADQFFWADTLQRLGVGAAPLRATALDARGLESRMRDVLSNPDRVARAEALAAKLREERGAQRACECIEQLGL
jgi:sterol 3beta-glucosyltransferase